MRYNYATGVLSMAKPLSIIICFETGCDRRNRRCKLSVRRNNVERFSLQVDGTMKLMNFANDGGVSVNRVYGNIFENRSLKLIQYFTDLIPQVMQKLNI